MCIYVSSPIPPSLNQMLKLARFKKSIPLLQKRSSRSAKKRITEIKISLLMCTLTVAAKTTSVRTTIKLVPRPTLALA